jgi:hypothetical protein
MLPAASLVARVRNEADAGGGGGCVISPERQELIYNEVCAHETRTRHAHDTTRHDTRHEGSGLKWVAVVMVVVVRWCAMPCVSGSLRPSPFASAS